MLNFLLRRTLGALVILLLVSACTFFLFYAVPRDPALLACGKTCDPESLEIIRANMGLDKPLPEQYREYMAGILTGRDFAVGSCPAPCFGYSFENSEPVWETILDRFPTTVSLALGGAVVFLLLGLGAGMLSAVRRGTLTDRFLGSVSLVLGSMQVYFVGPLAIALLVHRLELFRQPEYVPITESPADWFAGLLIPWFVLSLIFTAQYTRMSRATLIEQLGEDHVRTARAKGMPRRTVFFRYAWRGSLIPVVTIFGIDLGSLFGGAMVTEFTFTLPGLGRLAVESVVNTDLPMLMGVMLFAAAVIVACNVLVDAAYALIDPRVRLS